MQLQQHLSFDRKLYSKDLFKQFLYKLYAQIRHEIYAKIQEYKSNSDESFQKDLQWENEGYKSTIIRIDGKISSYSYHGSSSGDYPGLTEETFLKIAQSIDKDTIQSKVMILLKILKPQIKSRTGATSFDDIDESRLLM